MQCVLLYVVAMCCIEIMHTAIFVAWITNNCNFYSIVKA